MNATDRSHRVAETFLRHAGSMSPDEAEERLSRADPALLDDVAQLLLPDCDGCDVFEALADGLVNGFPDDPDIDIDEMDEEPEAAREIRPPSPDVAHYRQQSSGVSRASGSVPRRSAPPQAIPLSAEEQQRIRRQHRIGRQLDSQYRRSTASDSAEE